MVGQGDSGEEGHAIRGVAAKDAELQGGVMLEVCGGEVELRVGDGGVDGHGEVELIGGEGEAVGCECVGDGGGGELVANGWVRCRGGGVRCRGGGLLRAERGGEEQGGHEAARDL